MRRVVSGFIGATVVVATMALGMSGAANAATAWTVQTVPPPTSAPEEGGMTGVSCTSATNCEGVLEWDATPYAEQWNGTAWTSQGAIGNSFSELAGISCASASFCAVTGAGGSEGYTELWNGSSWYLLQNSDADGLYGVSCSSAKWCVAVGYTGDPTEPYAQRWNGKGWQPMTVPVPSQGGGGGLDGVSCVSASDCVATGTANATSDSGQEVLAYAWNGSTWTQQTLPAPTGATRPVLPGISCVSASACTAVGDDIGEDGDGGNDVFAETWNGTAWAAQNLPQPAGSGIVTLSGISCKLTTCTAVGSSQPASAKSYKARRVLAEYFNGSSWALQTTAPPYTHTDGAAVSCVAARTCTLVGTGYEGGTSQDNYLLAEHE